MSVSNGYHNSAIWTSIRFLFVRLNEERSLQNKCWHPSLIARPHFGCCCPHKKSSAQLRRTTCDLRTRVTKFIDFDGWIFEYLSRYICVTNLSFEYLIKITIKLTAGNFLNYHGQWRRIRRFGQIFLSVAIQNLTRVHMDFVSHNDLYYNLPKYWHFLLAHPVYRLDCA
jgi:hypothetical protein